MPKNVQVEIDKQQKNLIITIPLSKPPQLSKSEKTMLHATTAGAVETDLEIDGKPLTLNVNAYTYVATKAAPSK